MYQGKVREEIFLILKALNFCQILQTLRHIFPCFVHVDIGLNPPPPLVDLCGHLADPPSPLSCPRDLWMAPYMDVIVLFPNLFET